MPSAEFFARFGLLIRPNFLEREWCERVCREIEANSFVEATVGKHSGEYTVDRSIRSAKHAEAPSETEDFVKKRLHELQPDIEKHFALTLNGFQRPQFLKYAVGDHYRPHLDSRDDEKASETSRQRRVSVVMFLNQQEETAGRGSFAGGALTFYGLLDNPRLQGAGFPLSGETGLLVAFRPTTMHGVAPVIAGNRYTIVTWYY